VAGCVAVVVDVALVVAAVGLITRNNRWQCLRGGRRHVCQTERDAHTRRADEVEQRQTPFVVDVVVAVAVIIKTT